MLCPIKGNAWAEKLPACCPSALLLLPQSEVEDEALCPQGRWLQALSLKVSPALQVAALGLGCVPGVIAESVPLCLQVGGRQ